MEARAALIAANELLRYRPVDDVFEEWLDRVAELVRAAGALPHRPFRCTAPCPAWAKRLRRRPGRLLLKKTPWLQGAWPLGGTRSVRCQHSKNRAAKKSLARQKLPGRSLLQHVATILLLQHVGTCKTRLSVTQGRPWP